MKKIFTVILAFLMSVQFVSSEIRMEYNDGIIHISATNNERYFFVFESMEDYYKFYTDSVISQETVNAEVDNWISASIKCEVIKYLVYTGDWDMYVYSFFPVGITPGEEYIAFLSEVDDSNNRTSDTQYIRFVYDTETGLVEKTCDSVNKMFINSYIIYIRKGDAIYNIQGQKVK